jgi:K+-sensing histidine kinase KdpD
VRSLPSPPWRPLPVLPLPSSAPARALILGSAGFSVGVLGHTAIASITALDWTYHALYLGIAIAAVTGGIMAGVVATAMSGVFSIVWQELLWPAGQGEPIVRLGLFVLTGLAVSMLAGRLRTERQRAVARGERYQRLRHAVGEMSRATSADEVVRMMLGSMPAGVAPVSGGIALWNDDHTELRFVFRRPDGSEPPEWHERRMSADAPYPVPATARDGVVRWFPSHESLLAAFPKMAEMNRSPGASAALVLPLVRDDVPVGSAWLSFPEGEPGDADDRSYLAALAGHAAQALERARLFEAERDARVRAEAAEAAAAQSAATAGAVVAATSEAVLVFDEADRVVLRNPAAERLLGDTVTGTLGELLDEFRTGSGGIASPGDLAAGGVLRLGVAGPWLEPRLTRVGDGTGAVLELRDVTALRETAAAHDAFLGVLSHELRTPVTSIYGLAQYLDRPGPPERALELAVDIRLEADRLKRLVDDLLVLSRVERDRLETGEEPVLLQRLLPRVVEAERRRSPDPRYVVLLPSDLPPVLGDETYVEQVVRNLVANAAKYGPTNGEIRLVGSADEEGVIIRVLDDGPGFPEDDADHLFDLFYRAAPTARTVSGAGIGLFVTRQLLATMGGSITARRRPEGGAEFQFTLRRVEAGHAISEPPPELATLAGGHTTLSASR